MFHIFHITLCIVHYPRHSLLQNILTRKGPTKKLITNIFWLYLTHFQIFRRNKMVFLYISVSSNIAGCLDKMLKYQWNEKRFRLIELVPSLGNVHISIYLSIETYLSAFWLPPFNRIKRNGLSGQGP
jgi:hypothetical protein